MSNLTAMQRIEQARIGLMRDPKWQYLAGVLMIGETHVSDNPHITAATDGRNVIYGKDFVASITDAELRGVVLHETFHIMYRQLTVWNKLWEQDPRRANDAADYVINLPITDAGEQLPAGILLDEAFRNMDTRQVFDAIRDREPSGGFDAHDWEAAKKMPQAEQGRMVREIDHALREGAILAARSTGAGGMPRGIKDLLDPQINWDEALRDFVQSQVRGRDRSSWHRPNRRFMSSDIYLPTQVADTVGHIVFGADTSASISIPALSATLSELQGICNTVMPDRLDLVYWDWAIAGHECYEQSQMDDIIHSTKPVGGGGTDVNVLFDFVAKKQWKPDCMVIITDGYTPFPAHAPEYPVFWVMTSDVVAPFGVSVRIKLPSLYRGG